jgi:hypothetical protein
MRKIIFLYITVGFLTGCSKYFFHSYPFMDWSNPDSILSSFDTLTKVSLDTYNYICRFWIDPSSTIKQYIEICDINDGYKISSLIQTILYLQPPWLQ